MGRRDEPSSFSFHVPPSLAISPTTTTTSSSEFGSAAVRRPSRVYRMLRFGAIFGLAFPSWCSYVSLRYRLLFGVPELMLSWCYTMLCFGGCLWQFGLPKLTLCFALAAVFSSSAFPPELKLCFGSAFPRWYGLPELMLCSFVLRRYNPRTPGSIRRGRPSMTTLSSWRLADTTTKEEEKRWTTKTIENPHDPLPCWCYAPSCCGGTILVLLDRFDAGGRV